MRFTTSAAVPFLLSLIAAPAWAQDAADTAKVEPPAAMTEITAKELLQHATFLASDELGGRLTGSPGQEQAAAYIADHFAKLGLEPLGDEVDGKRTWLQHYGIARTHVAAESRLVVGGGEVWSDGFAVLGAKPTEATVNGVFQFCGLGRTKGKLLDLGEADRLDGKIAVVLLRMPERKSNKPMSIEQKMGASFGLFGRLGKLSRDLEAKGAAAVLLLQLEDTVGFSDVLNYLTAAPGKDVLSPRFEGVEDGMGAVAGLGGKPAAVPTLVLSVQRSQQLLQQLAVDQDALQKYLGKKDGGDEAPEGEQAGGKAKPALPNAKADLVGGVTLKITHDESARASNVVGLLRGSDPTLAAEAVVYSAHMDHVGRRLDGEVFNGADDNASGSAGLMAIATAYAKSKEKPRRSIVFLSVSGEELGLWGSAYFADHPTWPADKLIANINTDMIGRSGDESGEMEVTVTPSHRHQMFSTIVQDAARFGKQLGLTFTSGDKYYERSDHYNFAKKGIPVVFFCNGEHPDYHQVTDHADKLDGGKMERIARLAFWTGWSVANADEAPRKLGKRAKW